MALHLKIIGFGLMVLGLAHIIFPTYFDWKSELQKLNLINRQMMYVHTFFIALTVFLMGLLCVTSTSELLQTELGKRIALGFSIFWATRLFVQFFGYSSKLWRGKIFETIMHISFSVFWVYLSIVFFSVFWA